MKIKNPWKESSCFEVENALYEKGEFKIYKQFDRCYLHTYKGFAFNQLLKPNKELIDCHIKGERPDKAPLSFLYDRGRTTLKKQGVEISTREIKQLDIFDLGA